MGILPPSRALLASPTMIILLDQNALEAIDHVIEFSILVPNHYESSTKIDGNPCNAITKMIEENKVEWHPNQCYFIAIRHQNQHYF